MAARAPLMLALALLTSFTLANAATGVQLQSRRLLQAQVPFPFKKCPSGSAGSPYILTGDEPTTNFSDGSLSLTVTIASNPAADFSAPCANALSNNIKLLTIRIGAGCAEPGVIQGVYINGVLKTEGIETSVTGTLGSLTINDPVAPGAAVLGTTITIIAGGVCSAASSFSGKPDGRLVYYFSQSPAVECCPINSWGFGKPLGSGAPAVPGSLVIRTVLDSKVFHESDLADPASNPLRSDLQIAAVNASLTAAGLIKSVTGFTSVPDPKGPEVAVLTTYDFADGTQAYLGGNYLVQNDFASYIRTTETPCNSIVSLATSAQAIGAYSCTGSALLLPLPDLCVRPNGVCVAPPPSVQEGSQSEESASVEGSAQVEGSVEASSSTEASANVEASTSQGDNDADDASVEASTM